MGGFNPYIKEPIISQAQKKFRITFLPEGKTIEIDPNLSLSSENGLPGSILDCALAQGISIEHACGGVCACSTCHILIQQGAEACSPSTENEEDQLEKAPGLSSQSRLACQCVPNGSQDLIVRIPHWNRNPKTFIQK